MRVEPMKIEFASDEKYHRAHGVDAGIATCLAFGSLEQTIERFEESVGLPGLPPSQVSVEMATDRFCRLLHLFDFGAHDIGTPLRQQSRDDVNLLALKNLSQLFAVQPG